ncbi:hypothetical protein ACXNWJ_002940 [Acinetobacter baumannii]|uniref:hypothetical protein n=1 Tax=Acinetobacter baumannii TaxID=470 RepID=UPI000D11CEC8|nr:hypothetical protein [Acinetobacter baumannii]EHU3119822.1 hypothetical protein [Acinetobacter baumannii]EKV7389839.1 hypothetical protein [Acinetobacter baumannii]EKW3202893.1 hypothetical protein [Acinetobacter baumannii]EKX0107471.1 hypothetical protein [Acinetobacter baumannii]ELB5354671.1 hypothetical protein [Acinetobacter baumannii]
MSNIFTQLEAIIAHMNKGEIRTFQGTDYRQDWDSVYHFLCIDKFNADRVEVVEDNYPNSFKIKRI